MEIKDITGVYNIGKRRFTGGGTYNAAENAYCWTFTEIDENNSRKVEGKEGAFKTSTIPFTSYVFEKIMEAVGR